MSQYETASCLNIRMRHEAIFVAPLKHPLIAYYDFINQLYSKLNFLRKRKRPITVLQTKPDYYILYVRSHDEFYRGMPGSVMLSLLVINILKANDTRQILNSSMTRINLLLTFSENLKVYTKFIYNTAVSRAKKSFL